MAPEIQFEKQATRDADVRHWDDLGYSAVLQAEAQYADTNAAFKVYRIVCTEWAEAGGQVHPRGYNIQDSAFSPNPTDDFAGAEVFLEGGVKWDGCSNWFFPDSCYHFCEKEQAMAVGALFQRLYEWAKELGMDQL